MIIVRALLLGDVIGQPGCRAVFLNLKKLIEETEADFVVLNGENAAQGFGLLPEQAEMFWASGVDVITTGNHIWQKKEILPLLVENNRILRPGNYPKDLPGRGLTLVTKNDRQWAVMNLQGRMGLPSIDDPFALVDQYIETIGAETVLRLVDFHGEENREKEAFGWHVNGRVSAVVGTHTHVATLDQKILTRGTAYVSDLGMTGPLNSVIGSDPALALDRAMTFVPHRSEVMEGPATIQGVLVSIEEKSGKAISIQRVQSDAT